MKKHPLIVTLFVLSIAGCNSSSSQLPPGRETPAPTAQVATQPENSMPMCQIAQIESCDIETEGATETIFSCPKCGHKTDKCQQCEGATCEHCSETTCRCRLKNEDVGAHGHDHGPSHAHAQAPAPAQ